MILYHTERLYLRIMTIQYIDELYKNVFINKKSLSYTFINSLYTKEKVFNFIKSQFIFSKNETYGLLPIFYGSTLVGFCGILSFDCYCKGSYELGFMLGEKYWGKGYGVEIAELQLKMASEYNIEKIFATVHPNNNSSKKILLKIGMRYLETIFLKNRGYREIYMITLPKTQAFKSKEFH